MNPRSRISLDGQWNFSRSAGDAFALITVPSPWQADARFRDHTGTAWYERDVNIPEEWLGEDRVIILRFGAVDYMARVWVNEIRVGEHEGGYLPFELDITRAARADLNILTVRVDDPLEIFAEIPHGKQSWYGLISGIWQSVWLESRPVHHIQRVKISPSNEHVEVNIFTSTAAMDDFIAEVFAPNGQTVARIESRIPNFSIPVAHPLTWSPEDPNLYSLRVSTKSDEIVETFGFRTIETKDGQILLNGRPFYLRAALDQDYYPDLIYTPPSQEYIEEEFHKAKDMGLNCLRIHIKVADPRYYAAADKVGLLIWTELPNHILLSEEAKRRARETLSGMLERDGNHPCIGIWTIINESWGVDLTDPSQRAWLADTFQWLKELDPTRLVVGNSACWGNFHVATDLADFHIYYAMPDHQQQWRDWVAEYARRPWWIFAHEYPGNGEWRKFLRDPWHASERPLAEEVEQHGNEPLLVSEFGNWGLPRVDKIQEGNNGEAPWWFSTGLEWGDGVVYPSGVEQRFRQYHFDQVFPSLTALSEASQRLQLEALKFEIEQIRRHPTIQGYVITEFTDVHWESNGLLDMYRNPKIHYAQLKSVNSDDMLIPLWERLTFAAGDTCSLRILCSHYSPTQIKDAVLEWEVSAGDFFISSGKMAVNQCTPYWTTELGAIRFDIPLVKTPTSALIRLRLLNNDVYVSTTSQEIYLFPYLPPIDREKRLYAPELNDVLKPLGYSMAEDPSEADTVITTTLDDSHRHLLLSGGRVLFLAERDDALQTHIPGLAITARSGTPWQGDWASSLGWHRFAGVPTEGVVNFAFADLTPDHVIQGFAPRDFALDVYAGLFVGWLHKPIPTIARRRVGKGTLLVSTFPLANNLENNPLAMHLFYELLRLF